MNKIIVIGNLGRDPEMRYTARTESNISNTHGSEDPWDYNVTGRRITAALIDIALVIIVLIVFLAAFGETTTQLGVGPAGVAPTKSVQLPGWPSVVYFGLVFAYFIIWEGLTGQTLGKVIMGIKVLKVNGDRADWLGIILRNVLRVIDGLPIFYLVGLVCIAVTRRKQRLGDLASRTVVVRTIKRGGEQVYVEGRLKTRTYQTQAARARSRRKPSSPSP